MLVFDRSSLETRAARVDGRFDADDPVWQAGDLRPSGGITVRGRLSSAGEGRFYFSGRFEGTLGTECRRCLAPVSVLVSEELHLVFAESDGEAADVSDVYPIDPRAPEVDLRPALREQWLLAVPAFALCVEDCRGLCPRCGADLNQGPCACEPEVDPRWSALRTRRRDS